MKESIIISHALGSYNNYIYTNSLEALYFNYKLGQRFFEVDLLLTSDNVLVCHHSWLNDNFLYYGKSKFECAFLKLYYTFRDAYSKIFYEISSTYRESKVKSYLEFKQYCTKNNFTSLTFDQLISIMEELQDIIIITDTKSKYRNDYSRQFEELIRIIKDKKKIKDRIIPQVYNLDMAYYLDQRCDFNEYILTLYKKYNIQNNLKSVLKNKKIKTIAFNVKTSNETLNKYRKLGLKIAIYTSNSFKVILSKSKIVDYIYSDFYYKI